MKVVALSFLLANLHAPLANAAPTIQQANRLAFFEYGGEAYLLSAPEAVPVRGHVSGFEWSPDGNWLYVESIVNPSVEKIEAAYKSSTFSALRPVEVHSVFSVKTGKVRELFEQPMDRAGTNMMWDPFGRCLFGMSMNEHGTTLMRWDIGTWTPSVAMKAEGGSLITLAGGYFVMTREHVQAVTGYHSGTRQQFTFDLPEGAFFEPQRRQDPNQIEMYDGSHRKSLLFDVRTGHMTNSPTEPQFFDPRDSQPFVLDGQSGQDLGLYPSSQRLAREMELLLPSTEEDKLPPPLIVVGKTDGEAQFGGTNQIAFQSQGALIRRELAKVPRQVMLDAKLAAEKTEAISVSKQVAVALLMVANDWDDVLPLPEEWFSKTEPYIKTSDLLSRFTYTFPGGNTNDIKDPSKTEIGYVAGPGGRAMAYADGHVKWIPDKK